MSDEKLAIEGGTPVRDTALAYGRQWIEDDDIEAVAETLRSDYLTCGPKVTEAEKKLAEYTGAKYVSLMNSGTSALHAAAFAAGLQTGDEMIVTPFTFMASANCALYVGAKPVFADIDPDTYNINPEEIKTKITSHTKAVVAVDFSGELVNAEEIRKLCDKNGLVFIEDAAHSIGSKCKISDGTVKNCGTLADMTCMSFHPVKTVTAAEGGAVLTDNADYAEKVNLFRAHGMEHDHAKIPYDGDPDDFGIWYYDQTFLGYNYRMTDVQAALLSSQLKKIDRFVERRKELVTQYDEAFARMPEIHTQAHAPWSDAARHLYTIRLNRELLSCTRKEFFEAMRAENIYCQVHYVPTYYFTNYQKLGYKRGLCPVAESVYENIMSIPLFPRMTDEDQADVIKAIQKIVARYGK